MLSIFKKTALLEGVSFLVLLFNMLYIKNNNTTLYHSLLQPIGLAHGFLFIAYVILALLLYKKQQWSFVVLGIILLASFIPFGTFYVEKKYLK